jgi:apolipoprotein N-acyltransferase
MSIPLPIPFFSVLLPLLAGGLTVFAFAPFGWWPLQILALALLFLRALSQDSPRTAAQSGWLFGLASIAAGTHWLYVSLHVYGGLPSLLAIAAVLLLAASLGLLYGIALYLAARLARTFQSPTITALLILPAFWMLADWTRGWIFTGFPWLVTGYAHTQSPLSGFASLVGVYGLGWLAALMAGALALLIHLRGRHRIALSVLVALPVAGMLLHQIRWTEPKGEVLSVRLLQGNVPQDMKFTASQLQASLSLYQQLITEAPADLIVTPETALPVLPDYLPPDYLDQLANFAQTSSSQLLIGLPWTTAPGIYLNSVLGIGQVDAPAYRYDKHHLVPFGEFIPPGARWFVDLMTIPLGDFGRGDLIQPAFRVKDQWVLPNICYEDLFGEEIAAQLYAAVERNAPVPSLLLNVSNIAWFGDTIALPQHLQISQMRSLETGRPMLRATNTGMTAVIDARGEVSAQLPAFTQGSLAAKVQGTQGTTPYVRLGNVLPVGLALMLLLALLWKSRRSSKKG